MSTPPTASICVHKLCLTSMASAKLPQLLGFHPLFQVQGLDLVLKLLSVLNPQKRRTELGCVPGLARVFIKQFRPEGGLPGGLANSKS